MLHMHHAGFEIDVATLSGNPVKLEMWAMPEEDKAVMDLYTNIYQNWSTRKLADILPEVLSENSPYIAVFIPWTVF